MVPFGEETPCAEHLFRLSSFGTFPSGEGLTTVLLLKPSPEGKACIPHFATSEGNA